MGWLGWSIETVRKTDVNVIIIALNARVGLLGMIFGTTAKEKPKKKASASEVRAFMAQQRARLGKHGNEPTDSGKRGSRGPNLRS